ncbi:MAG: acyl-CoA dehydrogenase, partial [Paracoccaceae bacterium]|nr:acyl-CoA dehydrogenase [Paracoccaceae bacterium]
MPHDGTVPPKTAILPDLLALTGAVVPELERLRGDAIAALRARVAPGGKVSAAALDADQYAAHALSWLATYVESLAALHDWAARLEGAGRFGAMEALILQIGFGEYLH